ncbi:homocysteine S-methyltransferase family protein [Rhodohalobacter sp. 8-1]|uniref:homocysteine S-methyltransferase family protein n=1 Tax=Rhodohalobacter sp. 8-1 TaxID=3131972 RepID=UPI0030EE2DA9
MAITTQTMKNICLLDGGTGQEIYKRSKKPAHPLWSAKVMIDRPNIVKEVHKDFLKAGARILTINSYTVTPTRLRRDGEVEWFQKLQLQATEIALNARDELGSITEDVQIAACLPPLTGSYVPDERSFAEIKQEYEQIVALQEPIVDLFLIETIASIKEAKAASEAALESGKTVYLSFTLSDRQPNQLRSGESIHEALNAMIGYSLDAILFNCSFPETITKGMKSLQHLNIPFGGYANGFTTVEPLKPGETVGQLSARSDLDEEKYASHVMEWINVGASIVGGCCEVGPSHIEHLHKRIEEEVYGIVSSQKISQS